MPTLHTLESLLDRTTAEGDCLLWTGSTANGVPCVYLGGRTVSVRSLICKLCDLYVPHRQCHYTSCGRKLCIEPSHIHTRPVSKRSQCSSNPAWASLAGVWR